MHGRSAPPDASARPLDSSSCRAKRAPIPDVNPPRARNAARGITIIELMLALAILAVLATVATGKYKDYRERVRVMQAVSDIGGMQTTISQYTLDNRSPPATLADVGFGSKLDPWGRPYRYLNLTTIKGKGSSRKDKHLNPLNTDFDLYSVGKDGKTQPSLVPPVSHDDVVRARDGRFIGLASDFTP